MPRPLPLSLCLIAACVAPIDPGDTADDKSNFEKCYGISDAHENDGWEDQIDPGNYEGDLDCDGRAYIFVRAGTCASRGGQLSSFTGHGIICTGCWYNADCTEAHGDAATCRDGRCVPRSPIGGACEVWSWSGPDHHDCAEGQCVKGDNGGVCLSELPQPYEDWES